MYFASDNWAGAADEIAESLRQHSGGFSPAYGESDLDKRLEERFNELFEREVAVFFVGTGTAANSLALSATNRPGGFVLCHREAHLIEDECGAPEFFTSGARLAPIDGAHGKLDLQRLREGLERFDPNFVHHGQPMAVSLTQATEVGTVYSCEELQAIADLTHSFGLPLHMDGARFANAMVRLGVTPAEMTWKSGIDILSFGGTKNGCWCAEALVFMNPERAKQLPFIRKRAAQLFSKTRFIAAQFHAYLDDDLWISLAKHANSMADELGERLNQFSNLRVAWKCQSNELFVTMPKQLAKRLLDQGAKFYPWPVPAEFAPKLAAGDGLYRLVTSFATEREQIDQLVAAIEASSKPTS
ncbi:threonine aldolase family protein [Roseiconus lacunae]|uniref:L-threonine aldolase n=1 Tax=Roseiconus lacunae TaxID=2605694 RepID=A0ABT7PJC8_9BACT|nr:low specificity L-threonine aldolase [Roseiconus lacunae]MCD0461752.1 low specificity L-threonine aldolase [Roseiconus lacunae]MDM4016603.1 low specificity L-threonine aldolase [Roseiconus lacunae]